MKNREIISKLRECAKNLLDIARELQTADSVESPQTMELIKSGALLPDGAAKSSRFRLFSDGMSSGMIELSNLHSFLTF